MPLGAFQDRWMGTLHPHISEIDRIWPIWPNTLNPAVRIFFFSERRLPSYGLQHFGEVTLLAFL